MDSGDKAVVAGEAISKGIVRRVASNFGWSVVSEAGGRGIFFITNIYLARVLGVENFGLFTVAQAMTFYFWLAVDLGINMYGIREIAKNKENADRIINPLLTLRITAGLVVFLVYFTGLMLLHLPVAKRLTFAGCGLYLLTYSFYSDWILKGLEKFNYISFGSFVSSLTFLAGSVYFVRSGDDPVKASFIWALSYLLGSTSLLYIVRNRLGIRYRPSFDLGVWFSHLKESIYFTISGGLMVIYQYLPILMLNIFFTAYDVGIFSAAYRIVINMCSAGFLLPMAFYPFFSESFVKDRDRFRATHRGYRWIMISLGLLAAFVGTVFAREIFRLLLGSQYDDSIRIFKVVVWLVPLYFLRFTYGSVLGATGYQRYYVVVGPAAIAAFVCGFTLFSRYGVAGVSVLLLLSDALIVALLAYFFFKKVLAS